MKKIFVPLALVFMFALGALTPLAYSNNTFISTVYAQNQGLKNKKEERKARLDAIYMPPISYIDWSDVLALIEQYKQDIDNAQTVEEVEQIYQQAHPIINSMVDLIIHTSGIVNSDVLYAPEGYLPEKFELVRAYYNEQILNAATIEDADALVEEAKEKYGIIIAFEEKRNTAIQTINAKEPESTELASYVNLLNGLKTEYVGKIGAITGEPEASASIGLFTSGYAALTPKINQVVNDFNTAFDALVSKMEAHNAQIVAAVQNDKALEIIDLVFERNSVRSALSDAVGARVEQYGYLESVGVEAAQTVQTYFAQIEGLRNVQTEANLNTAATDIAAIMANLKTALEVVKDNALAAEAIVAGHKAEAKVVDDKIAALSANSSWDEINEVRMEYERLKPEPKSYIANLAKLEELEALKEKESPIIMYGIILIIVGTLFLGMVGAFMFVVIKKKKENVR